MKKPVKPCHCCGNKEPYYSDEDNPIRCSNKKCIFHEILLSIKDWNSRPIEDELEERLKIATKKP